MSNSSSVILVSNYSVSQIQYVFLVPLSDFISLIKLWLPWPIPVSVLQHTCNPVTCWHQTLTPATDRCQHLEAPPSQVHTYCQDSLHITAPHSSPHPPMTELVIINTHGSNNWMLVVLYFLCCIMNSEGQTVNIKPSLSLTL